MYDSFYFEDLVEGIDEIESTAIQSKTFPNPVLNRVTIEFENPKQMKFELILFNNLGEEILKQTDCKENSITLELSNFDPGIYTYRLSSDEGNVWSYGKVMKVE